MKFNNQTKAVRTTVVFLITFGNLTYTGSGHAATPLEMYKERLTPTPCPLVKWQADINGDQKPEVFIQGEDEYYGDPGLGGEMRHDGTVDPDAGTYWSTYIANADGTYIQSEGLEEEPGMVGFSVPNINNQWCYIGMISEIGAHGVVTPFVSTQTYEPDSTISLLAITVAGNHIKKAELASYPYHLHGTHPRPLVHKYLDDDKFTPIRLVRVAWFAASEHVADPVADLRSKPGQAGGALKKWTADIDGDGRPEIFLTRKDNHTADLERSQTPDWNVYLADSGAITYSGSTGIKLAGTTAVDPQVIPQIDPERCFVGTVSQISGRALVTLVRDVRYEDPWNVIYAYAIQDGHLVETKLAEYKADTTNPIYNEYLADDKRTSVTLEEVAP